MKNFKKVILGVGLVLALAGCSGSSLQELSQEEFKEMGGKVTLDYVKNFNKLKEVYSAKNIKEIFDEDYGKIVESKRLWRKYDFVVLGKTMDDKILPIGIKCDNYDENIPLGKKLSEKSCTSYSLYVDYETHKKNFKK